MRAVMALTLREISTTYGRSPGGYVWAVLEPAAGIALLTAIFSIGFRHPPLGTNFAFFYAGGMLPFLMFVDISGKIGQTIQFSRTLLNYPRVTFVDAILARLILNTPTQLTVHVVVLGFILLVYVPDTTLDLSKMIVSYLMVIVLAVGVGTVNSFLNLSYPIWQTIWAVLNRSLFLISCIFSCLRRSPFRTQNIFGTTHLCTLSQRCAMVTILSITPHLSQSPIPWHSAQA